MSPASELCPVCGQPMQRAFSASDRNVGIDPGRRFDYVGCSTCGTFRLACPPDDLGRFYPADYGLPPSRQWLEAQAHGEIEQAKLAILRRHSPPGSLVEVGPGHGSFALAAAEAGFQVTLVERDEASCSRLEAQLGLRAVISDRPEDALAPMRNLDAVAFWHVLEHVPDPWRVIGAAADAVRPGGIIVVAMPNPAAYQRRLFGGRWVHVDAPRHLWLVPADALERVARRVGLEPLERITDDAQARTWNAVGWKAAFVRRGFGGRFAQIVGLGLGRVLRRWERNDRGATYSLVFRRPL